MPLLDLVNEVLTARGIPSQTLAASTQGASIDLSDCQFSTGLVVAAGAVTVANVTSLVVQLEESTNGSSGWTAIPGMVVTVTATTTEANLLQVVRGQRTNQFVRANAITLAATTTTGAFPVTAVVIAGKKYMPQNAGGYDRSPST